MIDKSENIKYRILFPMTIIGAILISLAVAGGYWLQKKAIKNSVEQRISGGHRLYKELLREETQVMGGQIDFLKLDQALLTSFVARDRSSLIDKSRPLFERMRSKYRITHFYFHGPDKICFLRVHSPNRNGDLIDRVTMAGAVSSKKPFYGIELGPIGTFTLRVVHPWVVDDKLVGYIELGMEIEHITQLIKQSLNLELLVLIEKKFLQKEDWEAGRKVLSREGNWDLYHNLVIIDQTIEGSPILNEKLGVHQKDDESIFSVKLGDRQYKGRFKDLIDAGDRRVGEVVSLVEVTAQQTDLVRLVLLVTGLFLFIGGGLFLFFNNYIGGIQNRLTTSREKLRTEIEERQRKEEALATSEKNFRSIFEESKDAIVTTDTKGNLLMINPAGMKLFGLATHEIGSIKFQEFYTDPEMDRRFTDIMLEKGYLRNFGAQLNGKNKKVMDCLMTVTTKLSSDGTIIGYDGIIRDVTPFKRMEDELRKLATIDSLTNINNRRNFLDLALKEMDRSKRYKHPFSLIMLDIDHFKKVNDTYGHSVGDQVLIDFCDTCMKELRESDFMGRLGGEEFAVAIVECDVEGAAIVAERIRKAVASHKVVIGNEEIRFTVSIGITQMWQDSDLNSMLESADNALYKAKNNGRNQVQFAEIKPV